MNSRRKAEILEVKFSPLTIFRFPNCWTQKHEKRNFSHYLGIFEADKFSFFHRSIFSDFPRWRIKKLKKNFIHYPGFSKLTKTFLWMKFLIFLPQHISRFFKMVDQKTENMKFLYYLGVFEVEKNFIMHENFVIILSTLTQINQDSHKNY